MPDWSETKPFHPESSLSFIPFFSFSFRSFFFFFLEKEFSSKNDKTTRSEWRLLRREEYIHFTKTGLVCPVANLKFDTANCYLLALFILQLNTCSLAVLEYFRNDCTVITVFHSIILSLTNSQRMLRSFSSEKLNLIVNRNVDV